MREERELGCLDFLVCACTTLVKVRILYQLGCFAFVVFRLNPNIWLQVFVICSTYICRELTKIFLWCHQTPCALDGKRVNHCETGGHIICCLGIIVFVLLPRFLIGSESPMFVVFVSSLRFWVSFQPPGRGMFCFKLKIKCSTTWVYKNRHKSFS